MIAGFDDPAIVENKDTVGAADGGQPVRDHKCRSPDHQAVQRGLQTCLGRGINGGWRVMRSPRVR